MVKCESVNPRKGKSGVFSSDVSLFLFKPLKESVQLGFGLFPHLKERSWGSPSSSFNTSEKDLNFSKLA